MGTTWDELAYWRDISYLRQGTARQQQAYAALQANDVPRTFLSCLWSRVRDVRFARRQWAASVQRGKRPYAYPHLFSWSPSRK